MPAIAQTLHQTVAAPGNIEQTVSSAMTAIRYQDMMMQRIQDMRGVLAVMSGAAASVAFEASLRPPVSSARRAQGAALLQQIADQGIADPFPPGEMRDKFTAKAAVHDAV